MADAQLPPDQERRAMDAEDWGKYGQEPPCEHLIALRDHLRANGLSIWSEFATPDQWVNINCKQCGRTYQTVLDDNRFPDDEEL